MLLPIGHARAYVLDLLISLTHTCRLQILASVKLNRAKVAAQDSISPELRIDLKQ